MLNKLPPELRTNILLRLPVDCLLRFRCVSKSYCDEIDDPNFIETHLERSLENNSNQGMIFADVNPQFLRCVTFDSPRRVIELDYPLKSDAIFYSDNIKIVGSCNGLLCLSNAVGRVALINPSTRKSQTLPIPPVEHKTKNKVDCNTWTFGFGYDPIGEDYKVVRLGQYIGVSPVDYSVTNVSSDTMVYSLKSNSWRKKTPGMSYVLGAGHRVGVCNRMGILVGYDLHWLAGRDRGPTTREFVIVAFNLGSERFAEVPEPEAEVLEHGSEKPAAMCVGVIGKWLSLSAMCGRNYVIWVMKVYGVKESWTKLVSVTPNTLPVRTSVLSKNGEEFLFGTRGRNLVWYNPEKKTDRLMEIPDVGRVYALEVFHGSLVPLSKKTGSKKAGSKGKKKKR